MKGKLEQYAEWMEGLRHTIVDFHESVWDGNVETVFYKDFKPFRPDHTVLENNKSYLTIRCGLGGIYTDVNTWFNDHWGNRVLDGSTVIAYRELKPYEEFEFKS